uniref:DUF3363 domain-containing protein n=1 Tax=Parastrongyloides trichosuri TaxID=131310 RepID=A0A0N4ZLG3_PARTI
DRRRRLGERPLRRAELIDFLPRIDQSEGRPERGGLYALLAHPEDARHPENLIARNGAWRIFGVDRGQHDLSRAQCSRFFRQRFAASRPQRHAVAPPNVRGVQIDNHPVAGAIQGRHRVALDPQTEQAVLARGQSRLLPAFGHGQARVIEEAFVASARQAEQGNRQGARASVVCQIRELAQAEACRLQDAHQAFSGGPSGPRRGPGAKPL